MLADPSGAAFGLWEQGHRRGAQLVNEPGAWSMSALRSPDPAGAIAFYGAVFGWEPEPFGPATMFRLPGFVGGEPGQPVPRDVVAVLIPDGSAPAWGVDFWIDDVDAAVERVEKLGGSVLVPPHEQQPPFRQTVVADAEGTPFSLSQLLLWPTPLPRPRASGLAGPPAWPGLRLGRASGSAGPPAWPGVRVRRGR